MVIVNVVPSRNRFMVLCVQIRLHIDDAFKMMTHSTQWVAFHINDPIKPNRSKAETRGTQEPDERHPPGSSLHSSLQLGKGPCCAGHALL